MITRHFSGKRGRAPLAAVLLLALLGGCRGGGDDVDALVPDRGPTLDAGPADAGPPLDAAAADAAPLDAAPPDAAPLDAASPDAALADADPPDAGGDAACPAFADAAAPEPAVRAADLPRGAPAEQGCRLDQLFVDAPVEGPVPAAGFEAALGRRLTGLDPGWFCPPRDGACLAEVGADIELGQLARLAPLVPPGTPHAGEAPARFFRVYLGRPVLPDALPALVGAVRQWAGEAAQTGVFVGRECVAIALGTEPRATPDLRAYALARVGLAPTAPGDPVQPAADVAVIDTGLEPVVADELGARPVPLPGGDVEGPRHPHGSSMGLLVRQVTDRARLHDVRVLGTPGHGDIGDVARGVIAALGIADADRRRALVLNLSLGWPPELGLRRQLRDAAGDVAGFEDPVGEAVRYALLRAREDEDADRPIIAVAAAGNRPGRPEANRLIYNTFFDVAPDAAPPTACAGPAAPDPYLFFPAAWSQVPTCRGAEPPRFLAFAVGGVGDDDRPARLAIRGAEPALVAPAEHAYASSARAPASLDTFQCADPPVGDTFTSPTAVSGTSVAAAFTAGTLAHLVAQARDADAPVPGAGHLQRLVTAAGRDLGRDARALDACRAGAALACDPAACLGGEARFGRPDGLDDCADALAACPAVAACPAPPPPPPLPAGFTFPVAEACVCTRAPATPTREADCATADTLCPYEVAVDVHSRGAAGPQPEHPSCPECTARLRLPEKQASLYLALEKKLVAGALFPAAWVVFTTPLGKSWRPLADTSPLSLWAAGKAILIQGVTLDSTVQLGCGTFCTAELVAILQTPTGTAQVTVPLRVKLE